MPRRVKWCLWCITLSQCSILTESTPLQRVSFLTYISSIRITQGLTTLASHKSLLLKGTLHVPRKVIWCLWCNILYSVAMSHRALFITESQFLTYISSIRIYAGVHNSLLQQPPVKGALHVPRKVTWLRWCKHTSSVLHTHLSTLYEGLIYTILIPPTNSPTRVTE